MYSEDNERVAGSGVLDTCLISEGVFKGISIREAFKWIFLFLQTVILTVPKPQCSLFSQLGLLHTSHVSD